MNLFKSLSAGGLSVILASSLASCHYDVSRTVMFHVTGTVALETNRELDGTVCGDVVYTVTEGTTEKEGVKRICGLVTFENGRFKTDIAEQFFHVEHGTLALTGIRNLTLQNLFELPPAEQGQFSHQRNDYEGVDVTVDKISDFQIDVVVKFGFKAREMLQSYEILVLGCRQLQNQANQDYCVRNKIPRNIARLCSDYSIDREYNCLWEYLRSLKK